MANARSSEKEAERGRSCLKGGGIVASGVWQLRAVRPEVLQGCQAALSCVAPCPARQRLTGSYASMQASTDANLSAPEINGDPDHAYRYLCLETLSYLVAWASTMGQHTPDF